MPVRLAGEYVVESLKEPPAPSHLRREPLIPVAPDAEVRAKERLDRNAIGVNNSRPQRALILHRVGGKNRKPAMIHHLTSRAVGVGQKTAPRVRTSADTNRGNQKIDENEVLGDRVQPVEGRTEQSAPELLKKR